MGIAVALLPGHGCARVFEQGVDDLIVVRARAAKIIAADGLGGQRAVTLAASRQVTGG